MGAGYVVGATTTSLVQRYGGPHARRNARAYGIFAGIAAGIIKEGLIDGREADEIDFWAGAWGSAAGAYTVTISFNGGVKKGRGADRPIRHYTNY